MNEKEHRPGRETEATRSSLGATASISSPSAERLAQQFDGALVVVVATPGDKFRRRVFLTVAAAQRHAEKARERGYFARVYLAQLEPVIEVVE